MTRPMVWKLRATGLWAAQCASGHTYIYDTWREAYTRATGMKEKP